MKAKKEDQRRRAKEVERKKATSSASLFARNRASTELAIEQKLRVATAPMFGDIAQDMPGGVASLKTKDW